MAFLEELAFLGSAALVVIATACIVLAVWRQEFADPGSVLLERMLRKQGDAAVRAASAESREFTLALGRCLACAEAARCRAWLASGARDGYQSFCPNADFIERMNHLWTPS